MKWSVLSNHSRSFLAEKQLCVTRTLSKSINNLKMKVLLFQTLARRTLIIHNPDEITLFNFSRGQVPPCPCLLAPMRSFCRFVIPDIAL